MNGASFFLLFDISFMLVCPVFLFFVFSVFFVFSFCGFCVFFKKFVRDVLSVYLLSVCMNKRAPVHCSHIYTCTHTQASSTGCSKPARPCTRQPKASQEKSSTSWQRSVRMMCKCLYTHVYIFPLFWTFSLFFSHMYIFPPFLNLAAKNKFGPAGQAGKLNFSSLKHEGLYQRSM